MEDDNGDEADELDEALIPYDAQSTYQKGIYEGEHRRMVKLDQVTEEVLNVINDNKFSQSSCLPSGTRTEHPHRSNKSLHRRFLNRIRC